MNVRIIKHMIFIHRLTITASCPMNLQYFPMDRQLCHIEIESCKYRFIFKLTEINKLNNWNIYWGFKWKFGCSSKSRLIFRHNFENVNMRKTEPNNKRYNKTAHFFQMSNEIFTWTIKEKNKINTILFQFKYFSFWFFIFKISILLI